MKNLIFYILMISCFFSCTEDDIINFVNDPGVNLSNLKIGQKSIYVKYTTNCNNFDDDFQILPDEKISLEVISFGESGVGFRETILEGSSEYTGTISDQKEYGISQKDQGIYMPD